MTVKEFYETTSGDYQSALNTMMNDDFIKRMLAKFLQNNAVNDLLEAYGSKDYEKVFVTAHTLKGVTGNLALISLYNKVIPIVEATRNANGSVNIDSEVNDFKNAYLQLKEQLEILLK